MPTYSFPVSCSSHRPGSAGSALSRSRPARSLASPAPYYPPVMKSGSSSLIRWLISLSSSWWPRPLIKMSRLTGTPNVMAMISFTAASATSIRAMLPHPLRRPPGAGAPVTTACCLPAGPQAMRTGAEVSGARVVMLHKQGQLIEHRCQFCTQRSGL
jgi:hypothetical protein